MFGRKCRNIERVKVFDKGKHRNLIASWTLLNMTSELEYQARAARTRLAEIDDVVMENARSTASSSYATGKLLTITRRDLPRDMWPKGMWSSHATPFSSRGARFKCAGHALTKMARTETMTWSGGIGRSQIPPSSVWVSTAARAA
jgi:hypothetical protein